MGEVVSNPVCIEKEITVDFQMRFSSNHDCFFDPFLDFELISPILYVDDNERLIKLVTSEGIKSAVLELAPDKTPGPDGFPLSFSKSIGL